MISHVLALALFFILSSNVGINTLDTLSLSSKSSSSGGGCLSDDTQEDAGDNNKEEVSIISGTSSSNDDEYPKVSFMIRLPSVKIITVTFSTLSDRLMTIKREIQSQFGTLSISVYPERRI